MKKIIITSCIFLGILAFNNSQAQTSAGVKGGINFADVSDHSGNLRVSGNVGLYLHAPLGNSWSIQPELLYSGQGRHFNNSSINDEKTLALNYINVPVMLQYAPAKNFYLEAGPQIGFLTNAKLITRSGNKIGANSGYNKTDFALNVGAGVNATNRIGFFARYGFGLTDITKGDDQSYHNMVGSVGATIKLSH